MRRGQGRRCGPSGHRRGRGQWPWNRQADTSSTVDVAKVRGCPRRGRSVRAWVRARWGCPTPLSVTRTTAIVLVSSTSTRLRLCYGSVAQQVVDLPDTSGIPRRRRPGTVWACSVTRRRRRRAGLQRWPSRSGRGPGGSATVGCGFLGAGDLRDVERRAASRWFCRSRISTFAGLTTPSCNRFG